MGAVVITPDETLTALYQTILEQPAEDTPRLVYADRLDELGTVDAVCPRCNGTGEEMTSDSHGYMDYWMKCRKCEDGVVQDPSGPDRAVFIRIQIEIQKHPGLNDLSLQDPHFIDLSYEETRLIKKYEAAWKAPLRMIGPVTSANFRRGFVGSVAVSHDTFVTHAAAILKAAPVDRVILSDRMPHMANFSSRIRQGVTYDWWCRSLFQVEMVEDNPLHMSILHKEIIDEFAGEDIGGSVFYSHAPGEKVAYVEFPDSESAYNGLSAACVRHGRGRAELP